MPKPTQPSVHRLRVGARCDDGEDFLRHQVSVGNDLVTPRPQRSFPGLRPGDRWCEVAVRWLQAHQDGSAAPAVLASTHEAVLQVVPLEVLQAHAVDVPDDLSGLIRG